MGCFASKSTFEKAFEVGKVVGSGHFAEVALCVEKKTKNQYAAKIINKEHLVNTDLLVEEVDILKKVRDHPNVLNLYQTYENDESFYIITEYCSGGDLFGRIVDEGHCSEQRTVDIMYQLVSAIEHIHKCGVTHRDLKPENILLESTGRNARIKVADFGLSKLRTSGDSIMKTVCGTWAYCAPEVIRKKYYDQTVDNWTLGVLMYVILCGYHPFDMYGDSPEADLMKRIEKVEYDFDDEVWLEITQDAQDIITKLLQSTPKRRMTCTELLETPWINGKIDVKNATNEKALKNLEALVNIRRAIRITGFTTLAAGKLKQKLRKNQSMRKKKKEEDEKKKEENEKKNNNSSEKESDDQKKAWSEIVVKQEQ